MSQVIYYQRFLQYTTTQLFDISILSPVLWYSDMVTKDQIKEIENSLTTLITKAEALSPDRHGHVQQVAIRSFQKSINALGIENEQVHIHVN